MTTNAPPGSGSGITLAGYHPGGSGAGPGVSSGGVGVGLSGETPSGLTSKLPLSQGLDPSFTSGGLFGPEPDDGSGVELPVQPSYHQHSTAMSDFGVSSGPSIDFTPEDMPEAPDSQPPGPAAEPGSGLDIPTELPPQWWGSAGHPPPPEDTYQEGDSVLELLDDDDAPTVVS